ncbi:hypothetical protein AMECASPLE_029745 [Ameca splendens]|uniref:Uncharacterized protein n=1 Tax=Ameca splendens TaxID=208324 RepID=A0ABV0XIW6_9TELE
MKVVPHKTGFIFWAFRSVVYAETRILTARCLPIVSDAAAFFVTYESTKSLLGASTFAASHVAPVSHMLAASLGEIVSSAAGVEKLTAGETS